MTPTGRTIALVAAGAPVALLVALVWPDLWLIAPAWGAIVLGLFTLDALLAPNPRHAVLTMTAPVGAGVGDRLLITAQLRFDGASAALRDGQMAIAVDVRLAVNGRVEAQLTPTLDGAAAQFTLAGLKRGPAAIGPVWARWTGAWGLAQRQRQFAIDQTIAISPSIRAVQEDGVPLFARDAQVGQRLNARIGEGSEFESLVRFMPGLDRRAIDWKQSARHADLLAKQFETERDNRLVLAVDAGRMMCDPLVGRDGVVQTRLDCAVAAALSLAYVALRLEDRVSIASFAARPGVMTRDFTRSSDFAAVRRAAADIDYAAEESNFTFGLAAIGARLKRRALIVLFTEFADATSAELMLRAAGRMMTHHLLMFVVLTDQELESAAAQVPHDGASMAAATIAADLLRDRRLVLTRLRRMGALVVEAPPEGLSARILETYIRIKRQGLL